MMERDDDQAFQDSVRYISNVSGLGTETQLQLYGLYKISTLGQPTAKPSFFMMPTEKAKLTAWNSHPTLTQLEAKQQYTTLVNSLKTTQKKEFMVSVSTYSPIQHTPSTTLFEYARLGDCVRLKEHLVQFPEEVDMLDEQGMTALMYACDRGHVDVVDVLVQYGGDVMRRDEFGQSLLHVAATTDRIDVVKQLIGYGVDAGIADSEGMRAVDVTEKEEIRLLLGATL